MSQDLQPKAPMMIGADPQALFGGNMFNYPPPPSNQPIKPYHDRKTGEKVKIAFYMTVLFILLNLSGSYRFANTVYQSFTSQPFEFVNESGSPTMKGTVIFAVVFFAIAFVMLLKH